MRFTRFEEGSGYCGKCLRQVSVGRNRINHLTYLFLTLVTLGVYIIWWIRDGCKVRPWKCLECGAIVYKIMN